MSGLGKSRRRRLVYHSSKIWWLSFLFRPLAAGAAVITLGRGAFKTLCGKWEKNPKKPILAANEVGNVPDTKHRYHIRRARFFALSRLPQTLGRLQHRGAKLCSIKSNGRLTVGQRLTAGAARRTKRLCLSRNCCKNRFFQSLTSSTIRQLNRNGAFRFSMSKRCARQTDF